MWNIKKVDLIEVQRRMVGTRVRENVCWKGLISGYSVIVRNKKFWYITAQ
jgi:hypothetical protein